jgi:hypothetical protein
MLSTHRNIRYAFVIFLLAVLFQSNVWTSSAGIGVSIQPRCSVGHAVPLVMNNGHRRLFLRGGAAPAEDTEKADEKESAEFQVITQF